MNNYHIYEEIGRGKYSVVYKGRKKKTIEFVAVKSVDRMRRKKLMNEVRIFHNLEHPNVLKFYNWYETRNHLWIIFEYCPAGDLLKLLEDDKKLPEQTIKKFAFELVEGLSYLHENGIIFADLKPGNVLINEFSQLKLADFGLSKKISDLVQDTSANGANQESKRVEKTGSVYYMAPELFKDDGVPSFFSDFWSLGIVMYEMASGQVPFYQSSLQRVLQKITEDPVQDLPDFSEDFNDLIKRLLEKDPVRRITWHELKSHPFWYSTAPVYQFKRKSFYPDQPQFDKYLVGRGINPIQYHEQRANPIADRFLRSNSYSQQSASQNNAEGAAGVDILRLSMNVKRNMLREQEENGENAANENYHTNKEQANQAHGQGKSMMHGQTQRTGGPQSRPNNQLQNQNQQQHQRPKTSLNQSGGVDLDDLGAAGANPGSDDINLNDKNVVLNFGIQQDTASNADDHSAAELLIQQQTKGPSDTESQTQPSTGYATGSEPGVLEEEKVAGPSLFYPAGAAATEGAGISNEDSAAQQIFPSGRLHPTGAHNKGQPDRRQAIVEPASAFAGSGSNQAAGMGERARQGAQYSASKANAGGSRLIPGNQAAAQQQQLQSQMAAAATAPGGTSNARRRSQDTNNAAVAGGATSTSQTGLSATNGRKQAMKKKPSTFQPQVTMQSSPTDLQLLAENQLFQAYQVVYYNESSSQSQSSSAASTPSQVGSSPAGDPAAAGGPGGFTGRNADSQSNKAYSMKSSKVPHKPIEQLIIHNSDNQVKPIIGNKDIEKVADVPVHQDSLPFEPWDPAMVAQKIDTPEIESHLSDVYSALASNESVNSKLNALNYFESIIINSNVSNRLINSAFMSLLVKMLKQIKTPGIKSRLCSVVGLLIRHSTVIENELAETRICEVLVETMRDKIDKVRRKAIAALGEYMFYAATQLDDEQVDPIWELSYESIQTILRCLRMNTNEQPEDDIVRFYACKTLENICAQSNSAGHKFASLETINHLLAIFLSQVSNFTKAGAQKQSPQFYEALKVSSAVALSHICGLNPQLFHSIFERITAPVYCNTLTEGTPRVQQAFITMLNLALTANVYPKINDILLAEESFLKSLMKLHEHQSIVIRGKCLLTFLLLFKLDFRWMSVVQNQVKFFNMLDRVLKDNYKYVQCCLLCLIDGILEIVPTIFQTVAQELSNLIKAGGQEMPHLQSSEFNRFMSEQQASQLKKGGNLFFVSVILDLQTNQLIRNRMLNYPFIRSLSALLDNTSVLIGVSSSPQALASLGTVASSTNQIANPSAQQDFTSGTPLTAISYEFQSTLLFIAESISTNQKVILQMHDAIITFLLPVLLAKVKQPSMNFTPESTMSVNEYESRFLCLKIINDILITMLNEESIYVPHSDGAGQPATNSSGSNQSAHALASTQKINQFLVDGLLPLAARLLSQADPEPFYGQRLLSTILDKNRRIVKVLRSLQTTGQQQDAAASMEEYKNPAGSASSSHQSKSVLQLITEFYQVNHANLNKHTIIIVEALMEAKELTFSELRDFRIIDKTYQLIKTMLANKKEWCIELLLDINHHLLSRFNEVVKQREKEIARHIDDIFSNFDICVQLLDDHFEIAIIEKASQCLIQMLQLYALCQEKKREIFFVETHMQFLIRALECDKKTIQKRVLKCIYWALIQSEYSIELDQTKLVALTTKVESLMESSDKSICMTSKQIHKILKEQLVQQKTFQTAKQHQTQDNAIPNAPPNTQKNATVVHHYMN